MIRIILHGCNGRMGKILSEMILKEEDFQIAAGIDKTEGNGIFYPIYGTVEQCREVADVVIDFSNASAVTRLADWCGKNRFPLVICTTGMEKQQMEHLQKLGEQIPIVCAANLSIGINIIMKFLKQMRGILEDEGFDIGVTEKHHKTKVDAPSGTALELATAVGDEKRVSIGSFRGGTIVGEHEVILAGEDEVLEIKHTAYSRRIFGKGALWAAEKILEQPAGFYRFEQLLWSD